MKEELNERSLNFTTSNMEKIPKHVKNQIDKYEILIAVENSDFILTTTNVVTPIADKTEFDFALIGP